MFVLYLLNIYQTELFRPRNPYDTDLPVISDAWELSYFFFFRSCLFGLERGEWTFFCWLLEFLFEMSKRLHTHVIHVKLLPTYLMDIYSPIERWFNIPPPPPKKTLIGLNYNNNNHKKATNAGVRRNF